MTKRVTEPGFIRDVRPSDLVALLPGGAEAQYGLPPGCHYSREQVVYDGTTITHGEVVVTPTSVLPEGRIYVIRPADLVGAMARDAVPDPTGLVAWRVGRTVGAFAQAVLERLNFIPLIYEAGPPERTRTMPRPAHCLLTYSGVFGAASAPVEIWSWSMTFRDTADHGGTTQALADKASALWDASVRTVTPGFLALTRTRVAFLGDGQHVNQLDTGYDQADNLTSIQGSAGASGYLPLQTALAVSFYTARPGATGRGRAFLPLQGVALDQGDFIVSTSRAQAFADAVATIGRGMSTGPGPVVGQHAVMSSKGYATDVTSYRCGRVPDTMRSRRNALKESYVIVAD